jgi:predicted nucleotidyltransferase component of viral defense system
MLYYKTVEPDTLELLRTLMRQTFLKQFVLVGGTALALQIGHRKSVDLDLFTIQDFNSDELIVSLNKNYNIQTISQYPQTLICNINGIKVDFIRFKYKFIRPVIEENGIRLLQIDDLAAMKLDAVTGRGRKKDFYDIYYLLKMYDLNKLFSLFLEKYPHQTTFHVAKSLAYFVDAENDVDPIILDNKLKWTNVKNKIKKEIQKL